MTKRNRTLVSLSAITILGTTCFAFSAHAATQGLVKASTPAVYYATASGERFAFPNEKTFHTWFADFSSVQTISDAALAQLSLRANVTYHPGVRLVKITTDPKVYAVSRGGVLRWVTTEEIARALYGTNWPQTVDDIPDAFFTNYTMGTPIMNASEYVPMTEQSNTSSIEVDKGMNLPVTPPVTMYPGSLRTQTVNTVSALRDAVNQARPGDVIKIARGTYRLNQQWWVEAKGTAEHPIYIVAADGRGTASFTGTEDEGLNVGGNAAYLVVDGLEIHHTAGNLVHVQDGAHHVTLRNLNLHDAGPDGDVLKLNQAHHITVEGCDLVRPGRRPAGNEAYWQEAIDLVDVDDAIIRRNFIHDVGNMAGYVKGGSKRALIEENVIMDQRAGIDGNPIWGIGGSTDSELLEGEQYEALATTFRRNVIAHGVYGGLALMDAKDSVIEGNLFLNNAPLQIQARAGNGPAEKTSGVRIQNNTFTSTNGALGTVCGLLNHGLEGVTVSGNRYWNNGRSISTEAGCGFVPTQETGARITNPGISDQMPQSYDEAMTFLQVL